MEILFEFQFTAETSGEDRSLVIRRALLDQDSLDYSPEPFEDRAEQSLEDTTSVMESDRGRVQNQSQETPYVYDIRSFDSSLSALALHVQNSYDIEPFDEIVDPNIGGSASEHHDRPATQVSQETTTVQNLFGIEPFDESADDQPLSDPLTEVERVASEGISERQMPESRSSGSSYEVEPFEESTDVPFIPFVDVPMFNSVTTTVNLTPGPAYSFTQVPNLVERTDQSQLHRDGTPRVYVPSSHYAIINEFIPVAHTPLSHAPISHPPLTHGPMPHAPLPHPISHTPIAHPPIPLAIPHPSLPIPTMPHPSVPHAHQGLPNVHPQVGQRSYCPYGVQVPHPMTHPSNIPLTGCYVTPEPPSHLTCPMHPIPTQVYMLPPIPQPHSIISQLRPPVPPPMPALVSMAIPGTQVSVRASSGHICQHMQQVPQNLTQVRPDLLNEEEETSSNFDTTTSSDATIILPFNEQEAESSPNETENTSTDDVVMENTIAPSPYDIIPEGVDPSFLEALPLEMRREVSCKQIMYILLYIFFLFV